MKPRILIVGAGDIGAHLATRLCDSWEVSVLDVDQAALDSELLSGCATRHAGDGTSALVLRDAGAEQADTLVAATDSDEVNLEVLKLAHDRFEIDSLYAVMQGHEFEAQYRDLPDVELVDSNQAASALVASRLQRRKVATSIGLGEGEIIEVEVLANSSVIGSTLAELSPRKWLVGAVYRDGELIVPHGDTRLAEGDRVVIIGEPEVLGAIATHIGAGESRFPLHYGSNLVALEGPDLAAMQPELDYLIENSAAFALDLLNLNGGDRETAERLVAAKRDAGVIALSPRPLDLLGRIGLRRTDTARLLDMAISPVLIPRGSFPYRRLVLGLYEAPYSPEAAQMAIDVARTLKAELTLAVVFQPELVVGSVARQEMDHARRQVEDLARLYHLEMEVTELSGNPIQELLGAAKNADLLMLPYRRQQKASLTRPDVGQNLLHRAPCSTMVMPHGPLPSP